MLQIAVAVMAVAMAVVNGFMRSSFGAEGKNDDVSWTECLFYSSKNIGVYKSLRFEGCLPKRVMNQWFLACWKR